MQTKMGRRARRAVCLAVLASASPGVQGGTQYYVQNNGWSVATSWDDGAGNHGVPATGDTVYFTRLPNPTLSFTPATATLTNMFIEDNTTLNQPGNTLTVTQNEYVLNGSLNIYSSGSPLGIPTHVVGTSTVDGQLVVGALSGGSALVTLGAFGSARETLQTYGTERIGDTNAGGSFIQASGTNTIGGTAAQLSVGWDGANSSIYAPGRGV